MKTFLAILILFCQASCKYDVKVTKTYELYFDDKSYKLFQSGIKSYENQKYDIADSLFTIVIDKSHGKLSISMPTELNPYYYRGHTGIELDRYEQSLKDFEQVASDTTTNTDILMARTEIFKMLQQYDTAIIICNRLLTMGFERSLILSQRGICYYQKGEMNKACADFLISKQTATHDVSFLDRFMINCK